MSLHNDRSFYFADTYFPRLVDGEQWNEGRVEVWDGTRWERYCTTNFDIDEARVVCQQIGFPDYEVILPNDQFGVGFSPPSDVGFHCSSTENELAVCVVSPIKYTSYCGSVAVRCKTDGKSVYTFRNDLITIIY